MSIPLRVLIVEDDLADARLLVELLRQAGFEPHWERVESKPEYLARLDPSLDIILVDYNLPQFDGPLALALLQERGLDIPFIILSGTIGEDAAVAAMQQGATDYLIKDRLGRLGQAVAHALEQKRVREGKRQGEQRLAAQNAIALVLAESPSLAVATPRILQAICNTTAWEMGAIWYVERRENVLRCVDLWNLPRLDGSEFVEVTRQFVFSPGVGLPGRTWTSGKPDWICDIVRDTNFPRAPAAIKAGLHSAFAFPIRHLTEILGVIEFFSHEIRQPDKELLDLFASIGSQLGQFIARTKTEEALRRAEAKYRGIFENALEGIFQTSPDGRFLAVNPAMARMLGYDSTSELLDTVQNIPQQLYVNPAQREELSRRLTDEEAVRGFECRLRCKNGGDITVSVTAQVVRDPNGAITHFEGMMVDITGRQNMEEQLRQSQKMEAVGQLAGGVAHDFNNLLTIINGYSQLVLARLVPGDPLGDLVQEIAKAGERSALLTHQLLAFSRKQVLQPVILDLNALLVDMERMLGRLIREDVDLAIRPAPNLWKVKADLGQLEQVIMNLVVNARDAMPQGGKLVIETHNVTLDESYVRAHPDAHVGEHVLLAVRDTGSGMDATTRERIFEPFFTTKGQQGTGLGLATVYGIVKQTGGHIDVDSEVGLGATFAIYLPRAQDGVPKSKSHPGLKGTPRGSETVLLVEDDVGVRQLTRFVLEQNGYHVLEASNGEEALLICERHSGTIHILVTDVVMPNLSGHQVAERLTALRPGLMVLYLSGYTDDDIISHGVLGGEMPFLQKPFTPSALAHKVREVLDQKTVRDA